LLLLVMTMVVLAQVFCRYVISASLPWSEELARYLMVWLTFLGAGIALKKGSHMGLDILQPLLPARAQSLLRQTCLFPVAVFLIIFTVKGAQLALFNLGQHSPAMGVSMGLVYLALPSGGLIMLVHTAARLASSRGTLDTRSSE